MNSSRLTFGKSHGSDKESGAVGKGKTPLYKSGAESVNKQLPFAIDFGDKKTGSSTNSYQAVPRKSNPKEFRLVGTHKAGGGDKGPTSFPVSIHGAKGDFQSLVGDLGKKLPAGSTFVDAPTSPRGHHGKPGPRSKK